MNELKIYDPILEKIHSVPQWVHSQLALVSGSNRETPLPVQLSTSQKNQLTAHRDYLQIQLREQPDDTQTLKLVMEFIWATSSVNFPEGQIVAKGWAFISALRDCPQWCIAEAINRWHRGEVNFPVNFNFPTPSDLRKICLDIKASAEGKIIVFDRLLKASEQEKYSENHQQTMLEKLKGIFKGFSRDEFKKRIDPCETNIPLSK